MSKHTPYWYGVIRRAITRKNKGLSGFTSEHMNRAATWPTCACGEQDSRIPRIPSCLGGESFRDTGEPMDDELVTLGNQFMFDVINDNPWDALKNMFNIEQRSAEILKGLT